MGLHLSQPMSCVPLDEEEGLLRGEAVPGPPAAVTPPAGDATPPGGADACCVCLEELALGARGGRRAVPLPVCTRHSKHLGCLAQWRVQASEPRSLLCPLCRDVPCRFCSVECWGPGCASCAPARGSPSQADCPPCRPSRRPFRTTHCAPSRPTTRLSHRARSSLRCFAARAWAPCAMSAAPLSSWS